MKIVWLIVGVVLAGLVLGWWASNSIPFHPPQPRSHVNSPALDNSISAAGLLANTDAPPLDPSWPMAWQQSQQSSKGPLTNWEDAVEQIFAQTNETDSARANELLDLMPDLPLEGQVVVAQELGRLLPNESYLLLTPYLANPETPEPLLDVLMEGLLGRPDGIKLPLLLGIAQEEEHPKSEEALSYLEAVLGQNPGTNWTDWSALVEQRLQTDMTPGEMTAEPASNPPQ